MDPNTGRVYSHAEFDGLPAWLRDRMTWLTQAQVIALQKMPRGQRRAALRRIEKERARVERRERAST